MLHNILGFPRKKKCFTTNLIKLTGSEFSFLFFFFLKKKIVGFIQVSVDETQLPQKHTPG